MNDWSDNLASMSGLFQTGSAAAGEATAGAGLSRSADVGPMKFGGVTQGRRLAYPFDVSEVDKTNVPRVWATSNRQVSPAEFARLTGVLLQVAGLHKELPERKMAYMNAVWLAHAVNSASVSVQARATFTIEGGMTYNYQNDVLEHLGAYPRQYFRYAADDIARVLQDMHRRLASLTPDELETWQAIRGRAEERGLQRMPWFAFDAADGVTSEVSTAVEREQIRSASAKVKVQSANSVDDVPAAVELTTQAAAQMARDVHTGARAGASGYGI